MKNFLRPTGVYPRHLIPAMIFVAVLVAGVRINDAWQSLSTGALFYPVASSLAETGHDAPATANEPTPITPKETKEAPKEPAGAKESAENKDAKTDKPATEEKPAPAVSLDMELAKKLADRREQLDKREKELDSHEALIKVAEQRVDQKIKEMETLRAQLQTMVNQLSGQQQAQIENLVKIYETMKPKEAARIFESLEMPILLGVVQRMKPAKTALVMAAMTPDKAKELTVALTKQDQLPELK